MLDALFSPLEINGKTLRNRTVVPAMVMNYCNEDGTCTERFTAYHETKAKGGFGMIITEDFAVSPGGKGFKYLPGLWNDEQIPGFTAFTEQIHKQGAVIVAQIYHAGRQTSAAVIGHAPWAPSAIPCPFSPDMPHEMTQAEIQETVSQFGDCAYRAKQAGFETTATPELIAADHPDVVICANGATPIIPKKLSGSDKAFVVTANDVLAGRVNTGANVVVVGGGDVGCETANHLASNLRNVTLVEMLDDIATDEVIVPRWGLLADMKNHGVRVCTKTTVKEIKDGSVVLEGKVNEEVPVDTVVLAVGSRPNTALSDALKDAGYDVRVIGEAKKAPGNAWVAITEGFNLGREI